MVLELKGDIRETPIETIAHGVNCQGVMGSGVARALFEKWPRVRESYLKYHEERPNFKPQDFLGRNQKLLTKSIVHPDIYDRTEMKEIYNMHTQLNFGSDGKVYVDYSAVLNCFRQYVNDVNRYEFKQALAVPKIGAGLAGGDWNIIKKIMIETTQKCGNIDLVIYHLEDRDGICPAAY
jgi:O-acetyl-ADP-ribose deacetylase (regulator of RNase III)